MTAPARKYGWVADLPDVRDKRFSVVAPIPLPDQVDLRFGLPVYDQQQLGSCTAHAIAAALQHEQHRQKLPLVMPSRLFIYYNERAKEHSIRQDGGAQIRTGIKSVAKLGVCPEDMWPYDGTPYPPNQKFAMRPPGSAFTVAKQHRAVDYARVPQTETSVRQCLALGFPIVFGFTVYEAFESEAVAKSGILSLPHPDEKPLGGHAVLCVGYDVVRRMFIVRNSWGPEWGVAGAFALPFDYLLNSDLADDLWVIRLIT